MNPTIPTLSYVDIPNYKTIKQTAQIIPKATDRVNIPKFDEHVTQEGLQYDQTIGRSMLMKEREAAMRVSDYQVKNFITNVPHQSELQNRILNTHKFTLPNVVYISVISDARTLPNIHFLEELISTYYSKILVNNIINIYSNSQRFYFDHLSNYDYKFQMYEKFIYLLTYIQIVLDHRNQREFIEKDERIIDVIEWCLSRKLEDINFLLQGPITNQIYSVDYIKTYNMLISPSSDQASVNDYLTLATLQEVNANFLRYRDEFINNPNVYDKNPNYAQSYTISIDTRENAHFKLDNVGNLVVDCNDIDLGSSTNDNIDLNIDKAIVNTENLKHEPKSQPIKFNNLLHQFSIFRIKSLLILKSTYKTALRNYDTCYITFPNITLDGRFNQVYRNGALQIAGKFKENNNNKFWEFEPFNDVVYISKTANVKRFEFYISPKPGTSHKPTPNNFKIAENIKTYFNIPIRVHTLDELNNTPLASNHELLPETYIIRSYGINKKGNPNQLEYTFLYNRTYSTIQLLRSNYTISDVPKFGIKKVNKNLKIDIGMMPPKYPATRVYIMEAIHIAHKKNELTFRIPRVVPLTNLKALEYLVSKALINKTTKIKLDTKISSRKFTIPEGLINGDLITNKSINTQLDNFIEYIKNNFDTSEYEPEKFKNEIINKINNALVNHENFFYLVHVDSVEEFDFAPFNSNMYEFLDYINSKEYSYESALNIQFSAIQQIFTIQYIQTMIEDSINNKLIQVHINGTNYDYFKLYFDSGEPFIDDNSKLIENLTATDFNNLFIALSNHVKFFNLSINNVQIFIKYIEPYKIQRMITKISSEYVLEEILSSDPIKQTLTYFKNDYQTYYLLKKQYFDEIPSYLNKAYYAALNELQESFKINSEEYYIEYYKNEIKQKIYDDIYNTQTGKITINSKEYQYVLYDENDKDLVFEALKMNQNYYYKNNQKIPITLNSLNIVKQTAKLWTCIKSDILPVTQSDYQKGYVMDGDDKYYIKMLHEEIAHELNNLKDIEYTNIDILHDCNDALNNLSTTIRGVEWIKIAPIYPINDVLSDMKEKGETYSSLILKNTYSYLGTDVPIHVKSTNEIRYDFAEASNKIWDFAEELEGMLSDEYYNAKKTYEAYCLARPNNVVDTSIDLPDIKDTDDIDTQYQKWSNYYDYYGLFIPDFNYIIDYTYLPSQETTIYSDESELTTANYNLYDWLVPIYQITNGTSVKRVSKRIIAYHVKDEENDIGYFEDITFTVNDQNYHLKDYYVINGEYFINGHALTIEQLSTSDERYEPSIYKFTLAVNVDGHLDYTDTANAVKIDIPDNGALEIEEYTIEPTDPSNPINHECVTIGLDPSIDISSVKINNTPLTEITDYEQFLSDVASINVLGTYLNKDVEQHQPLKSTDFEEYSQTYNDKSITIDYKIKSTKTNIDGTTMTLTEDEEIEYPNNITVLHDMNGGQPDYLCVRDFNLKSNLYKTFLIEEDLLNENIKFSTNNWLYSIKKLTNFEAQSSPYINIQDLKLKMLTTSDKIADLSQYIQPVLIKYFVQWIDNYNLNLIVNSTNFGFSDISAFIENEEHKLQKITDNLFSLDYNNIIENNLEIYSSGSRFKMIIQLL